MILKLEAGQRIAFAVRGTEVVEGKFGQQIKFSGDTPAGDAILFLNIDPARRQLARIALDERTVVGQTVEFERVNKEGTLFTNINRVNGNGSPQPTTAPAPRPAVQQKEAVSLGGPIPGMEGETSEAWKQMEDRMAAAITSAKALAKLLPNVPANEDVRSLASSLFIEAGRKGIV